MIRGIILGILIVIFCVIAYLAIVNGIAHTVPPPQRP